MVGDSICELTLVMLPTVGNLKTAKTPEGGDEDVCFENRNHEEVCYHDIADYGADSLMLITGSGGGDDGTIGRLEDLLSECIRMLVCSSVDEL